MELDCSFLQFTGIICLSLMIVFCTFIAMFKILSLLLDSDCKIDDRGDRY